MFIFMQIEIHLSRLMIFAPGITSTDDGSCTQQLPVKFTITN
jgi:hypothetical protein